MLGAQMQHGNKMNISADKTLLIVDDDTELRTLLNDYFSERGFSVLLAENGQQMREQVKAQHIDLIILDLMLPGEDGLRLCRDLSTHSKVPILMLTARGDEMDRIVGLEMGADDYMHKPFIPRELLARVKNILRRTQDNAEVAKEATEMKFSGWTLSVSARHLIDPQGVLVSLPAGEFRLLRALVENANRVLTRDQLLDIFSGREAGPFDRTIDVMISRLRRRLKDEGGEHALIRTVRSEGYMMVSQVEQR